ncbi:hypothetical protein ACFL2Q_05250 [Thermodesulfobacteriota bacterium]
MKKIISKTLTRQEAADLLMTGVLVRRISGTEKQRRQLYLTVAHDVDFQTTVIRDVDTGKETELSWDEIEFWDPDGETSEVCDQFPFF